MKEDKKMRIDFSSVYMIWMSSKKYSLLHSFSVVRSFTISISLNLSLSPSQSVSLPATLLMRHDLTSICHKTTKANLEPTVSYQWLWPLFKYLVNFYLKFWDEELLFALITLGLITLFIITMFRLLCSPAFTRIVSIWRISYGTLYLKYGGRLCSFRYP